MNYFPEYGIITGSMAFMEKMAAASINQWLKLSGRPFKTNPPLVVDADTVLTYDRK